MKMHDVFSSVVTFSISIFAAARKHWLTTVTLLLALIGGVPGVIAIYDYFLEKAEVAISVVRFDAGELQWPENANRFSYLLLEMEVFNETDKSIPLSTDPFELTINVNGRWVRFIQTTIPLSGTVLYRDTNDKSGANIDHMDLQKYRELNTGRLYGHFKPTDRQMLKYLGSKHYILFLSKEVSAGQIETAIAEGLRTGHVRMRLQWRDVRGELHESHHTTARARMSSGCYKVCAPTVQFYTP
jgi:hypothetical protein